MKWILLRRCSRHKWCYKRWHILVLSLFCVIVIGFVAFFRCRPILQTFAESQALWVVTQVANELALTVLQNEEEMCDDIVSVVYDDCATVSAVHTNTAAVNRIRTLLTKSVMQTLKQDSSLAVAIPFGTLTGIHWLSGWGPLITFPISFTASVLSSASSQLSDVAINQSKYCVYVHLYMSMYVVTPGGRSTVETTMSFPMAETVLLGEVPDNLTEVFGDDQSLTGQIFDYGTTQ